jgi:hypothetical protein
VIQGEFFVLAVFMAALGWGLWLYEHKENLRDLGVLKEALAAERRQRMDHLPTEDLMTTTERGMVPGQGLEEEKQQQLDRQLCRPYTVEQVRGWAKGIWKHKLSDAEVAMLAEHLTWGTYKDHPRRDKLGFFPNHDTLRCWLCPVKHYGGPHA